MADTFSKTSVPPDGDQPVTPTAGRPAEANPLAGMTTLDWADSVAFEPEPPASKATEAAAPVVPEAPPTLPRAVEAPAPKAADAAPPNARAPSPARRPPLEPRSLPGSAPNSGRGRRFGAAALLAGAATLGLAVAAFALVGGSGPSPEETAAGREVSGKIVEAEKRLASLDDERKRREDVLAELERRKNAKESELAEAEERVAALEERRSALSGEVAELEAPASAEVVTGAGSPTEGAPTPIPPARPVRAADAASGDSLSPNDPASNDSAPNDSAPNDPRIDPVAPAEAARPPAAAADASASEPPAETRAATAGGPVRVFIHVRAVDRAAQARARAVASELRRRGVAVAGIRGVPYAVRVDAVRYFYDADRDAVADLQQAVRDASLPDDPTPVAQDYRRYRAPPRPGTVELWLS